MIEKSFALLKPKLIWVLLLGLGILIPLGSAVQNPVSAQQTNVVDVRIVPAAVEVSPNNTVEVAVEIVDVTDLYAFALVLAFDPAVVQVVDANPSIDGVQVGFGTFMEPGAAILNLANNPAGVIEFAFTQLNPSPPKSGSGNLIVITFSAVGESGESPIVFLDAQLAQQGGHGLEANAIAGQITVIGQTPPGPTATTIPIQPVGTSFPTATSAANPGPTSTSAPVTATSTSAAPQQPSPTASSQPTTGGPTEPTLAAEVTMLPTATVVAEQAATAVTVVEVPPTIVPEVAMTVQAAVSAGESVSENSNALEVEAIGGRATATDSDETAVSGIGENTDPAGSNQGQENQENGASSGLVVPIIIGLAVLLIGIGALVFVSKR